MSGRIKVTGYLNVDELEPGMLDLAHESGLSEEGHDKLFSVFSDHSPTLSELEDSTAELESE